MTWAEAIAQISVAVERSDLESRYSDFLNQAVRECAVRHSWDELKAEADVSVLSGQRDIEVPDRTKELQNGRFPVLYRLSDSGSGEDDWRTIPCYAREEVERLLPVFRPDLYIVWSQDNGRVQLKLNEAQPTDLELRLYYFEYPAAVDENDSDENVTTPLLDRYPNMVIAKALSLIFQSINDPAWQMHETVFRAEFTDNSGVDITKSIPRPRVDKQ